jgi:ribosomal protein S18 acetylase RimI-like enzyme
MRFIRHINGITGLKLRKDLRSSDKENVERLVQSTGIFSLSEIKVAIELIEDGLQRGSFSEYQFIFADFEGETVGYISYGRIPMTENRFDLYWIVVRKAMQCISIGSLLLCEAELHIAELGGMYLFIETSSRSDYKPARDFYRKNGYLEVAHIPDYYSKGDNKVIFMKALSAN